jgi:hypothetical protein
MDELNFHFLPSPTRSRDVSGDGQTALVDMLGVSPSRARLTGPHRCHPGDRTLGRSSETAVSPHYNNNNNQSTLYNLAKQHTALYSVMLRVTCLEGLMRKKVWRRKINSSRLVTTKVRRCLRHNLCSQPYGSKSLVRSTGSAVWNF